MKPIPIAINLLARQLTTSHSLPLRIGITGGIGSGKSYICHLLEQAGHRVFYCDEVAKHIIRVHPTVRRELTALVGKELYDTEGELLKPVLRAYLCQGTEYAARVNAIVHPRVAEAYVDFCQSMASVPTVETSSLKASFLPSRLTAKSRCISSSRYPWGRLRLWSALCSSSRVFVHWWKKPY